MKCRIALVCVSSIPISSKSGAGIEAIVNNTAKNLSNGNFEIHIFSIANNKSYHIKLKKNLFIHYIPNTKNLVSIKLFFSLFKACKQFNIDLIHCHSLHNLPVCTLIKYILHIPLIFNEHNMFWYDPTNYPQFILLERLLFKRLDKLIVLTNSMKEILSNMKIVSSKKIITVPNFLNIPPKKMNELQNAPQTITAEFSILFVGRVSIEKGIKYLISGFAEFLKINPNSRLIIIGPSEKEALRGLTKDLNYISQIKQLIIDLDINNHITFTGRLPPKKVFEWMKKTNVLVLPSLFEAFGIVLLEAMAAGLPIIATETSGISDIIINEQNGLLIPVKNSEAIKNALIQILNDKNLKIHIIKQNFSLLKERFLWDSVKENLLKAYFETINPIN